MKKNKKNKQCVNHKDGNPSNNKSNNLEWCTFKENVMHSINFLGNNPRKWKSKPIIQKNLEGKFIKRWENAYDIQRELGFCQVSISRCCRGIKKGGVMYGYEWEFEKK